ncbi:GAF domain-containing protein [Spirulina subsalsa FACHB-351]|uniref:GAF domain-containing protein n=1 Tax=Spirulina subsalsa FACHB-351 TaxID=234711 RepID=A0ABT3LAD5_9CYAN|nr:GAF domain-containing protein [Spirulina subsalsa]MCW6038432.1 GAF domain-containing protein [Spirulina subsalsa FACHB-351]
MTQTSPSNPSPTVPTPPTPPLLFEGKTPDNGRPEETHNNNPKLTFPDAAGSLRNTLEQHFQQVRSSLARIRDQMSQATNSETLLNLTTQHLQELTQASRTLVYRFTSDSQGEVLAESVDRGWTPARGESLPVAFFGAEHQGDYQRLDCSTIDYVATTQVTPYQLQLLEKFQVRSSVSCPILLSGQIWGLLTVQQCNEARRWNQQEINLIEQIATALALHLVAYEFGDRLQQQARREQTVAKVIDRIRRSLDIKTIFQTTTQEVRQLLKADRVGIYRFNNDWSGRFVAESVTGGWASLMQNPPQDALLQENSEDCNLQLMIGSKDPKNRHIKNRSTGDIADTYLERTKGGTYTRGQKFRVTNDVYAKDFPPCYIELLERFQARAYLTVGVYQGDKLWGLLATYQCSGPRKWEEEEIALVGQIADQLGVALQQAASLRQQRLQAEQLKRAVERERAIALVSDKIKQSLDTQTIFKVATEEIRKLLKSDRVVIYRFNPDWSGQFLAESVAGGWLSLMSAQDTDERILAGTKGNIDTDGCTIKQMRVKELAAQDTYLQRTKGGTYRQGEKFRVSNDIYKSGFPDCYIELLESFQAKAYITVPIFLGDKLWGLLANYQCSGSRVWQDEEINLVVNLGGQLGIALQRAQDLAQVKAQAQRLEEAVKRERTIAVVSDKIKQSLNTDTIFRIATQEVRELLKADRVGIYRFNEDWSGEFVAESVTGNWKSLLREQYENESLLEATKVNIDTEGCTIKQMTTKEVVTKDTYLERTKGGTYVSGDKYRVCHDVYGAGFPRCYVELLERFQARAYVTVPIFLGKKLWGLMASYQCSGPRQWTSEEINLVVNLGGQLGIALQRGEDLEQLRLQAQKLEEAVERERAIALLSDKIKQSTEIKTIFRIATTEARKVFKSDRVGVYRFNPDWSGEFVAESVGAEWLPLLGAQFEDGSILDQTKANIDTEGCTIKQMRVSQLASQDTYLQQTQGGTYRKGEQFRATNDIYESGFPPCYVELLESFQARAYITVPIFLGDKLWGLMANYQCSGPRQWDDAEIKLMVQLGLQLGIALQRA